MSLKKLKINKDWIGNSKSIYSPLGASNHSKTERADNDFYATEPRVIDELFAVEEFNGVIWECACGLGHLSKQMEKHGKTVISTDLIYRGYGTGKVDFLLSAKTNLKCHIITNPPYNKAKEFIEKALDTIAEGYKIAMFLKLTFLEGQTRYKFFKQYPPKIIYVYSSRRKCAIEGRFDSIGSGAVCFAWFIWEKGIKTEPIIRWIK